jgi:hypothetical protein
LGHVESLSMAQQVSIFTSELIDLLKIDVELHNLQDLDTTMSLPVLMNWGLKLQLLPVYKQYVVKVSHAHRTAARYSLDWFSSS